MSKSQLLCIFDSFVTLRFAILGEELSDKGDHSSSLDRSSALRTVCHGSQPPQITSHMATLQPVLQVTLERPGCPLTFLKQPVTALCPSSTHYRLPVCRGGADSAQLTHTRPGGACLCYQLLCHHQVLPSSLPTASAPQHEAILWPTPKPSCLPSALVLVCKPVALHNIPWSQGDFLRTDVPVWVIF